MQKINRTLFDMDTAYKSLSQAETWKMVNVLTNVKHELEDLLMDIEDHSLFDNHYKEQKDSITEQLFYVNTNIKTLQDVLLAHETKFIEKRTNLGDLGVFCLN